VSEPVSGDEQKSSRPRLFDNYLTEEELAARFGLKPNTLAIWRCRRRGPPYVKMGRIALYPVDTFEKWLRATEVVPGRSLPMRSRLRRRPVPQRQA
jgi:hypothetical protein